jgi:transcriptional regulator with XRE-family HTH domain
MSTKKLQVKDNFSSEFRERLAKCVSKFRFKKEFCDKTGVSEKSLSRVLNGLQKTLGNEEIAGICLNLGISATWLLTGQGPENIMVVGGDKLDPDLEEEYNPDIQIIQKLEEEAETMKDDLISLFKENKALTKENADLKERVKELESQFSEKFQSQGRQEKKII